MTLGHVYIPPVPHPPRYYTATWQRIHHWRDHANDILRLAKGITL